MRFNNASITDFGGMALGCFLAMALGLYTIYVSLLFDIALGFMLTGPGPGLNFW